MASRVCFQCGQYGHLQSRCPTVRCYTCHGYGHLQSRCRMVQCYRCGVFGHMSKDCRAYAAVDSRRQRTDRCGGFGHTRKDPAWHSAGNNTSRKTDAPSPAQQTKSPDQADARDKDMDELAPVKAFFQRYPSLDTESHCYLCLPQSPSKPGKGEGEPLSPTEKLDSGSNIRSVESVKRVAESIFRVKKDSEGPFFVLTNKLFSHLHEAKAGPRLGIPHQEQELQHGDFDILVLHPVHGYIHVEVKAFGDVQSWWADDDQRVGKLVSTLDKAAARLDKGRRALTLLQPGDGVCVPVVSGLALPNVAREDLRRALVRDRDVHKKLATLLSVTTENRGMESACLCSDDLPPKDAVVDEKDQRVRTAVEHWWAAVTYTENPRTRMSGSTYRYILASFCHNEAIRTFAEFVQTAGAKFETLRLNERQKRIIESDEQYVYVSGPPGSGKTVVLAEKIVQWLAHGNTVYLIYTQGKLTNQPAAAFLWQFIERITPQTELRRPLEVIYPSLHRKGVSNKTNINEFIENVISIQKKPALGRVPRSQVKRAAENMFDEITSQRSLLGDVFSDMALPGSESGTSDRERRKREEAGERREREAREESAAERGEGMVFVVDELVFVIDEFNRKTSRKRKTPQLISSIRSSLPRAVIWCAGLLASHCPRGFHTETLSYPYRSPPNTQRLLKALEPFCLNPLVSEREDDAEFVFHYATSSTDLAFFSAGEGQGDGEAEYHLPSEGPRPVFLSHAGHGGGEIVDCPRCASTLVDYLTDTLGVGRSNQTLQGSDVLVVMSSTSLYYNMRLLQHTALHRRLITALDVNVYRVSDVFDLARSGVSIMHVRCVAGMEKKVVVYVPCLHYQASPVTYADAVRYCPMEPRTAPQHSLISDSASSSNQTAPATAGHGGTADSVPDRDGQRYIRHNLGISRTITTTETDHLVRLGVLNLYWLWYAASRTLSHTVIFVF